MVDLRFLFFASGPVPPFAPKVAAPRLPSNGSKCALRVLFSLARLGPPVSNFRKTAFAVARCRSFVPATSATRSTAIAKSRSLAVSPTLSRRYIPKVVGGWLTGADETTRAGFDFFATDGTEIEPAAGELVLNEFWRREPGSRTEIPLRPSSPQPIWNGSSGHHHHHPSSSSSRESETDEDRTPPGNGHGKAGGGTSTRASEPPLRSPAMASPPPPNEGRNETI